MELRHLRYFLAAAEDSNITRAAQRLGIAQPPLTQTIKALEAELGVALFDRVGRRVELTQAGTSFREAARGILERVDQAKVLAQQTGRGDVGFLRVGFTGSAAFDATVTRVLREYRSLWPKIELVLEENRTSVLLDGLARDRLDAAFVRPLSRPDPTIVTSHVSRERMVVAVPLAHRLARRKSLRLDTLRHEPFILYSRPDGHGLSERVVAECERAGFTPFAAQESPQMTSTINMVAAALGVAVVPACMRHLRPDSVRFLDLRECELRSELQLARRSSDSAPTVRHLVDVVNAVAGRARL